MSSCTTGFDATTKFCKPAPVHGCASAGGLVPLLAAMAMLRRRRHTSRSSMTRLPSTS
jgi:uncharacterized protein (TIGR03382 family)